MRKKILYLLLAVFITANLKAQVTTSSVSGKVVDAQEALIGATIQVTHIPSGTKYGTITNADGRFALQGLRPGGPYKIVIAYLGHITEEITGVNIPLGETLKLDAVLKDKSSSLSEVVVVASASKFNVERTGATTNISQEKMAAIPTISRNISDIARLSPYAGNGMSFAGGDGRSSNFTVDGANLNNNFGLSSSLPGGGSPISLDAIQEVQVVIAPFDVRQSNFIGGGVNAITKSGTNDFKGTAYVYTTNQRLRGNKIGDYDLGSRPKESTTSYGFTLGGPIIKNKLFFFANVESEKSPGQVIDWRASTDGVTDNQRISRVTEKDLQKVSEYLKTKYGYNTGSYTDFPGDRTNIKWLGRIDWNITNNHKLSLRYNHTKNQSWNAPNGNSTDGGYRDSGKNRMSAWSMSYANSMYSMENIVNSATAELNSRFGNKISNQLLFTYSDIQDVRGSDSSEFPFIDIMSGDIASGKDALNPYISAGYELFTFNNGVKNKITTITDNFTYYLNAHKITGGLSFEHQMADNNYMRNGTSYYRYASLSDFLKGAAPVDYALTYGTNGKLVPSNAVAFSQYGAYVQDEWNIKPNIKFTAGIRADYLVFTNDIMTNNAILNLDFGGRHINTGEWAKAKINLSPRIGFNWDIKDDKSIILRGGSGLFTGRLPLVFFTNMPSNAGMNQILQKIQTTFNANGTVKTRDSRLDLLAGDIITDPAKAIEKLGFQTTVTPKDGSIPSSIAGVDRNFRMPQVWKSALAVDYKIPVSFPLSATFEATYTKNINAVKLDNYAVKNPDNTWQKFSGSDNRYIYPTSYLYNSTVKDACVLTNTSKGYGYTMNLTVNAQPIKHLDLMAAYTHTEMKEVSGMPGSNASSAWVGLYSIDGPNNTGIQRSQYVLPDRIIANASYKFPTNTTLSLFYTGYSPYGNTFYYSNDMNGDGNKTDLIYIPKERGDIKFKTQADEDAFFAFIEQDSYLKKHKGEYAEAYAARAPFVHKFDLKFVQDFIVNVGRTKNTLSLGLDVMNFGNLLKSTWGVNKNMAVSNYGQILTYEGKDTNNTPTFSMIKLNGAYPTKTYDTYYNKDQCWSLQISLKYRFN